MQISRKRVLWADRGARAKVLRCQCAWCVQGTEKRSGAKEGRRSMTGEGREVMGARWYRALVALIRAFAFTLKAVGTRTFIIMT